MDAAMWVSVGYVAGLWSTWMWLLCRVKSMGLFAFLYMKSSSLTWIICWDIFVASLLKIGVYVGFMSRFSVWLVYLLLCANIMLLLLLYFCSITWNWEWWYLQQFFYYWEFLELSWVFSFQMKLKIVLSWTMKNWAGILMKIALNR